MKSKKTNYEIFMELPWHWPLRSSDKIFLEGFLDNFVGTNPILSGSMRANLIDALGHSLSLSYDHKKTVVSEYRELTISKYDELMRVFTEERKAFIDLEKEHPEDIKIIIAQQSLDWASLLENDFGSLFYIENFLDKDFFDKKHAELVELADVLFKRSDFKTSYIIYDYILRSESFFELHSKVINSYMYCAFEIGILRSKECNAYLFSRTVIDNVKSISLRCFLDANLLHYTVKASGFSVVLNDDIFNLFLSRNRLKYVSSSSGFHKFLADYIIFNQVDLLKAANLILRGILSFNGLSKYTTSDLLSNFYSNESYNAENLVLKLQFLISLLVILDKDVFSREISIMSRTIDSMYHHKYLERSADSLYLYLYDAVLFNNILNSEGGQIVSGVFERVRLTDVSSRANFFMELNNKNLSFNDALDILDDELGKRRFFEDIYNTIIYFSFAYKVMNYRKWKGKPVLQMVLIKYEESLNNNKILHSNSRVFVEALFFEKILGSNKIIEQRIIERIKNSFKSWDNYQ